eukprot:GHVU01200297.1.p2 GENE.GHVU01200297.1~~GHVU01200297.1.p2  ORF type:complete len:188 (+),score=32.69 GHVU01200297.1:373-936(+)
MHHPCPLLVLPLLRLLLVLPTRQEHLPTRRSLPPSPPPPPPPMGIVMPVGGMVTAVDGRGGCIVCIPPPPPPPRIPMRPLEEEEEEAGIGIAVPLDDDDAAVAPPPPPLPDCGNDSRGTAGSNEGGSTCAPQVSNSRKTSMTVPAATLAFPPTYAADSGDFCSCKTKKIAPAARDRGRCPLKEWRPK